MNSSTTRLSLKDQIEAEEREIAILKRKLALSERVESSPSSLNPHTEKIGVLQVDDLLDILDALGSRSGEASKLYTSLMSNGESDVNENESRNKYNILRLQPLLSGIEFNSIKSIIASNGGSRENIFQQKRTYELHGSVYLPSKNLVVTSNSNRAIERYDPMHFHVLADISLVNNNFSHKKRKRQEFDVTGQIQGLKVYFPNQNSSPELEQLTALSEENKNLPRFFQDLVSYAEFARERKHSLENIIHSFGDKVIQVLEPSLIRLNHKKFSIDLEWKFNFSTYINSHEILKLAEVQDGLSGMNARMASLFEELKCCGLHDLVESTGSCEKAIMTILDSMNHCAPSQVHKSSLEKLVH